MLSIANAITVDGICYYTCLQVYIPFKFTATFYGYVLGECFFFEIPTSGLTNCNHFDRLTPYIPFKRRKRQLRTTTTS